jgi:hypothetical protein
VPLGTGGEIIAADATDDYFYTAGDASALYTGQLYSESGRWPQRSSGDLDKWIRHVVFFPDLQYFVTFDDVVSPTAQQVNWWYNAVDIYNEDRNNNPPSLTMSSDNIITQVVGNKRMEIKMLEPAPSDYSYTIDWNTGLYDNEFSYILVWPTINVIAPRFLTVMTADNHLSTGSLQTAKVEQGNCLGVMVDSGNNRDLILFSSDGNHVNQNIELGGYYQSADGNPYTFSGTQVLADFDNYQVMRLETGTGGNHAPVLASIGNKSSHPGWPLQFTVSATDPNGDPLTYTVSNLPAGASFTLATLTFSGTAGQAGTYSNVHFEVSDGVLTDSENITITITTNNAPVLGSIGNKTVADGQQLQFVVTATDTDNDTLTYSASGLPSGATFNSGTRTFSWTPAYNQAGTYTDVLFSVTDSELTDSEDMTITVTNVNRPPVLGAIGNRSVNEGQALTFTISATDPDGGNLTYSASNLPPGAIFTPATRTFTWTPGFTQAGSYPNVHFQVNDGGLTDSKDITITVEQLNGDANNRIFWYRNNTWWLLLIAGLVIAAIAVIIALLRRFR